MLEFQFEEDFEPTSNTKEWWLYTHKTESSFVGVRLPGMFQTSYFEWQVFGLISVFILEGVATYWASYEGVIITAIAATIFIDFVLAIIAHIFQKTICKRKNELVYADVKVFGGIKKKLEFTVLKQNLFYALILISAGLKIYWFFSVYGVMDATTLFIMTCYLTGALLHITCTGYAVFTIIFNWKIRREHNKYDYSSSEAFAFDPDKSLPGPLNSYDLFPSIVGRHFIGRADSDDESGNRPFLINTFGVLTDAELHRMIGEQTKQEQSHAVAISGVRHQMKILQQTPAKGGIRSNISK